MKILMLDTITYGDDISLDKFKTLGEVITYRTSTQEEALQRIKEIQPDVVVTNKVVITKELFEASPNIKMVAETATGYNNIDIEYAKAHQIRVANVAGYSTESVVQHTFALLFYVYEKLRYYDEYVKSGEYVKSPCFTHFDKVFNELSGKTWGIAGLGSIGRRVADVAKAFGCRVVYFSASGHTYDTEFKRVSFDELLENSDIISIHAPLNDKTNNLFDDAAFAKMKKNAVLLNLGRGPIVNNAALMGKSLFIAEKPSVAAEFAKALKENIIAGAGLDVIDKEPIAADNPLLEIQDSSKLIITPHIAWATYEARVRLMDEVYENIKAFEAGESRNAVV